MTGPGLPAFKHERSNQTQTKNAVSGPQTATPQLTNNHCWLLPKLMARSERPNQRPWTLL